MNRRIRVAIIDDGINEKMYNTLLEGDNIEIIDDLSIVERNNYDALLPSHGTTCAAIINRYANKVDLSSIKILNEKTKKATKGQLLKALYWCAEHKIQIVNLSLGTIDFRDFDEIRNCINVVTEDGLIIIAACNNKNVFTYPSCLPNVIGVRCCSSYFNDQYCINDNILLGIEFASSGRHYLTDAFGNSRFTRPSNSFAAALITAKVCDIVRNRTEITLEGIKKELYIGALNNNSNRDMYLFHEGAIDRGSPKYIGLIEDCLCNYENINISIPVIRIIFDDSCRNKDSLYLLDEFNKLFRKDGYYSIAISDLYMKTFSDFEYFPYCEINEKRYLSYICKKYNCDIILLGYSLRNREIDIDLERYHECDIQIFISVDISMVNRIKRVNIKVEEASVYVTLTSEVLSWDLKCLFNTILELLLQEK